MSDLQPQLTDQQLTDLEANLLNSLDEQLSPEAGPTIIENFHLKSVTPNETGYTLDIDLTLKFNLPTIAVARHI